jgi:outer membrane murein-binding lipoprotein Lpp
MEVRMRLSAVLLSTVLLAVLAGCVNTDTGPSPNADDNPTAIGAGEAADADTQGRAAR